MQSKLPMKELGILRLNQGWGILDWCACSWKQVMRIEVRNFKAFPLTWVSHGFNWWLTNPLKLAINVTLGWGVPPIPLPLVDLSISKRFSHHPPWYPAMKNIWFIQFDYILLYSNILNTSGWQKCFIFASSKCLWMTVNIWSGWSESWTWVWYCPWPTQSVGWKGGWHSDSHQLSILFLWTGMPSSADSVPNIQLDKNNFFPKHCLEHLVKP